MTERVTATTKPYTIGRPPFRPGEDADFGGNYDYYLTPGDLTRTVDVTDTLPLVIETTVDEEGNPVYDITAL